MQETREGTGEKVLDEFNHSTLDDVGPCPFVCGRGAVQNEAIGGTKKGKGENQCTVVMESLGALKGKRVIRGKENVCAECYRVI